MAESLVGGESEGRDTCAHMAESLVGGESEGRDTCAHVAESLAAHLKVPPHC